MAIRNLEIRKEGEGYTILDQAGSNPNADQPIHRSHDRAEAEQWLQSQGGALDQIGQVLNDAESGGTVYLEIPDDGSENTNFPKR